VYTRFPFVAVALSATLGGSACRRGGEAGADAGSIEVAAPSAPAAQAAAPPSPAPGSVDAPELQPAAQTASVAPTAAIDPHAQVPNYREMRVAREPPRLEIRDGRILFMNQCAACHAPDGTGRTRQPGNRPDFTAASTQDRLSDKAIIRAVNDGHAGSAPYSSILDHEQVQAIVQFVRALRR
jgi:mono/diheme cytochrome c family protein